MKKLSKKHVVEYLNSISAQTVEIDSKTILVRMTRFVESDETFDVMSITQIISAYICLKRMYKNDYNWGNLRELVAAVINVIRLAEKDLNTKVVYRLVKLKGLRLEVFVSLFEVVPHINVDYDLKYKEFKTAIGKIAKDQVVDKDTILRIINTEISSN